MNWRALLFFPATALGVAVIWHLTHAPDQAKLSQQTPPAAVAVRAKVIEHAPLEIEVTGYGHVEPVRKWNAVSQVEGRIVSLAEGLAEGRIVEAGTVLIEIDPRDYEIKVAQAEANLATAQAQLQELAAKESNTRAQAALEREIKGFLKTEFERVVTLIERGSVAASSQEKANRELLNQQRKVLDLENQIALIPVQRISADAAIDTRKVELEEAERDLERTRIFMPFQGRISSVGLSVGEFVRVGTALATADDISASEVVAAIQPEHLANAVLALVDTDEAQTLRLRDSDQAQSILAAIGFKVVVQLTTSGTVQRWPAEFSRFVGASDTQTGTVGLVVRVHEPLKPDSAQKRPPLNNGTFVEVLFQGHTKGDRISLPRNLVNYEDGAAAYVFVADENQTLQRRDVVLGRRIENRIFVTQGLTVGDTLVLSVPQPAILGQRLILVTGTGA
jgi:multidrug efflux pump subunit AcrA (membrane-fusion protein)